MTEGGRKVRAMSFVRRIEIGVVATLALIVVAAAALGAGAGTLGLEMPKELGTGPSSAASVLGWLRVLIVAALLYGVARVRGEWPTAARQQARRVAREEFGLVQFRTGRLMARHAGLVRSSSAPP